MTALRHLTLRAALEKFPDIARTFDEIVINGVKVNRGACQRYMREWQDKIADTHDKWREMNDES